MPNRRTLRFLCGILIWIFPSLFFPLVSWGGLEGNRSRIPDDARKLGLVAVRTDLGPGYTAMTLTTPGPPSPSPFRRTLTVTEFMDASGKIFAVAWKGSALPDLSVLLGPGFSRLARRPPTPDRHRLIYQDSSLVVRVFGTSRSRVGQAWNPGELPPGFSPSMIRVETP